MKRIIPIIIGLSLGHQVAAQSLIFGDCCPAGMAVAATACTDGLMAGIRQPQVLRRPGFPAEITTDDSVYTLPAKLDKRYAAFAFDAVTATHDGFYAYRYRALNTPERILTDSVYVRLKRNGPPPLPPSDTIISPPDTVPGPVRLPVPAVVNLVVIDHRGFHRFRILNADAFTRLELTLYDKRGAVILRKDDYLNDYDMSNLPADTYYYRLRAHTPDGSVEKKGFVELVKPKQ